MKKIVSNLIILIVILFIILIAILSTIGIETNKFNNLISEKATETKKINLELDTIKFKINPKELSLFLETQNPKIIYRKISVPVNNIKVYISIRAKYYTKGRFQSFTTSYLPFQPQNFLLPFHSQGFLPRSQPWNFLPPCYSRNFPQPYQPRGFLLQSCSWDCFLPCQPRNSLPPLHRFHLAVQDD